MDRHAAYLVGFVKRAVDSGADVDSAIRLMKSAAVNPLYLANMGAQIYANSQWAGDNSAPWLVSNIGTGAKAIWDAGKAVSAAHAAGQSAALAGAGSFVSAAPAAFAAFEGGRAIGHLARYIPTMRRDSSGNRMNVGQRIDEAGEAAGNRVGRWWYGDTDTGQKGFGRFMPWNRGSSSFVGNWQNSQQSAQSDYARRKALYEQKQRQAQTGQTAPAPVAANPTGR